MLTNVKPGPIWPTGRLELAGNVGLVKVILVEHIEHGFQDSNNDFKVFPLHLELSFRFRDKFYVPGSIGSISFIIVLHWCILLMMNGWEGKRGKGIV